MDPCSSPPRYHPTPSRTPSPLSRPISPFSVHSPQSNDVSPTSATFDFSSPAPSPTRREAKKMFVCQGYGNCTMAFSRSEHLARHVRKHTGERPFKCHCGRDFSRLDNLRQHAQTVHADQTEANQAMMSRLTAIHNQLAAQTSTKKRKANSSSPPGRGPSAPGSASSSLPLLPPAPISMASFARQNMGSSTNYVASPRTQPSLSDAYLQFAEAFSAPPSPYLSHPTYGMYSGSEYEADGRSPMPSTAAMVPRQMPPATAAPYLSSPMTTSLLYPGQTAALYQQPDMRAGTSVTARPLSYSGSPAPYQASVLQPFSPAQTELYETDPSLVGARSTLAYAPHSAHGLAASAQLYYAPGMMQSHGFDGVSDDGTGRPHGSDVPVLSASHDGASSSHPSPSTPSPIPLASHGHTQGLGDIMPPDFYLAHDAHMHQGSHASLLMARAAAGSHHGDDRAHFFQSPALSQGPSSPRQPLIQSPYMGSPAHFAYGGQFAPASPLQGSLKRQREDDYGGQLGSSPTKKPLLSS